MYKSTTVDRNLHITLLNQEFKPEVVFTSADLLKFYQQFEPKILKATVNWRVYELVKKEIIERIGKGRFRLGSGSLFTPDLNTKHFKISSIIKSKLTYSTYCIWATSFINEFVQHIPKNDFTLVDVERGTEESVFYELKEQFSNVFLTPSLELLNNIVYDIRKPIIVRTLVSEAPYREVRNIPVATLEKMLVDLFSDDEFTYLQGNELTLIFKNAFEKYTINENKMFRYADRKRKKEALRKMLFETKIMT